MDKYLIDILKDQNTIIIPGIGALTITDKEKNEVMFMPFLKHDDGTLSAFIAQKEGWDENEAKNLIAKYVREIEAKVNVGESYDMYRFGSFRKDSSGDLIFENWKESNAIQESRVEEVAPEVKPVEEAKVEIQEKEDPVAAEVEIEDPIQEENQVEETKSIVDETPHVQDLNEEKSDLKSAESIDQKEEVYSEEQQWEDDLDLPPINATKPEVPKKPILEKAKRDKKRRSPLFYAMITVFVLIIGGLTTIAVFYNDLKGRLPFLAQETELESNLKKKDPEPENDPSVTVEESNPYEEEVLIQEEEEEEEVIEEVVVQEVKPAPKKVKAKKETSKPKVQSSGNGNYHVIVGSFGEEANANRFSSKLQAEGFSSSVIGNYGGMYLVSISSHASRSEAGSSASSISNKYPKNWIFKKP
jgi:cell division protein FtsN